MLNATYAERIFFAYAREKWEKEESEKYQAMFGNKK